MKNNPCKQCGSKWHTKMYHKPRKPIRREAVKTKQKRKATETDWFTKNPPDEYGRWRCYISKHPRCPIWLTIETVVLEHDQSKARRKDLQFDINNIHPACAHDNKAKGSKSAEEYMHAPDN